MPAATSRYGSLRIWKDLAEAGEAISRKRVIRLMLSAVYAIAARISRAVLESDGVAVCCIDSALK